MADESVILNPGSGGAAIAVDTINGISHELVKVEFGSDGTATQVDADNPLPVTDVLAEAALASIAAEDFATEATLSSVNSKLGSPLPLPTGAATADNQQTDALTNAELRLTPVPISGSVSVTGGAVDNTILYTGTLNSIGAITGFDTTGYASISIQISGTWVGNLNIESCNDNALFLPIYVLNTNEIAMQDNVYVNGNYVFKVVSKYARVEVNQLQSGSVTILILGRTSLGISGSDMLSLAMDRSNNMPFYVEETATKKDSSNALIPSDAPKPIYGSANVAGAILNLIDTTGYQSISVQFVGTFGTSTVAFTSSNDGVNFASVVGYATSITSTQPGSAFTASAGNIFVFPCTGRFFRVTLSTIASGVCQTVCQLRQISSMLGPINANLNMISGSTTANGGVTGGLAVAGGQAAAATAAGNPVLIAGIDSSNLIRRFLTDTSGRLITNSGNVTDQSGVARTLSYLNAASGIQNVVSLPVQDISQFEGKSFMELLAQILLELRIVTYQLKELPLQLNGGVNAVDEPEQLRNEQYLFNN